MRKLIIANWKCNPDSLGRAVALAKKIDDSVSSKGVEVVIASPFVYVSSVKYQVSRVKIGAQNCFWESKGPFTGEVSPVMLKNSGVEYVIVGHSERRRWLNETDEMINKKVLAALKAGLRVILCVGEPLAVRKKGLAAARRFIKNQLQKDLRGISSLISHLSSLIVAYEPVWAISTSGTGTIDTPEDAVEMIRFIKKILHPTPHTPHPRVLYGGSVDSKNIRNFLQYKEIDGALVGGASLKVGEFRKIIKSALLTSGSA